MQLRILGYTIILAACLTQSLIAQSTLQIETAFENLSFSRPVDIQHAGDGTNRLFVVEQNAARIVVFENDQTTSSSNTFLQLSGINTGGEEGLLGLAFHPDYINNGHFFVYYSAPNPRRSVLSRFTVSTGDPNAADPDSELIIMEIDQPFSNHNGGQLAFGPFDGFLYIGLGDGGDGGDPGEHGENPKTLLGSMLRIDVNNATEAHPYAIPADNPFVGNLEGFKEEIFAYGLRNPWRFSIDPETGNIWAGDVGQGSREEIDLIEKGGHYGWDIMEATLCFEPRNNCIRDGLIEPIWEYGRSLGVSITGGHVYRGNRVPEIAGKYIYADYSTGRIWALTYDGNDATNELIADVSFNIPAFGVSEDKELFIAGFNGKLHRFTETQPTGIDYAPTVQTELGRSYPNPSSGNVIIPFRLEKEADIEVAIIDLLGRKISVVAEGTFSAGEHQVIWTEPLTTQASQSLPNGAYFYTLSVGESVVATKVLTLVK